MGMNKWGEQILGGSVFSSLKVLLGALPPRRRKQLILLLGLTLLASVAEVVSLGAVLPFLAVMADPKQALQKPMVHFVATTLGLDPDHDLRWRMTALFAGIAILAAVVRLTLTYVTARVNYGIGHELGSELFRRALYQPYETHTLRNSSEVQAGIGRVDAVTYLLYNILCLISAACMACFVVAALLVIDPIVAAAALFGFGGIYAIVMLLVRKKLNDNSIVFNRVYTSRVQAIDEGLGGIRHVLLDQSQERFAERFNSADWVFRQAQASNNVLAASPRFIVEALGMVLIACLAYVLTTRETGGSGLLGSLPILGAMALGAQRLMPLLQQIYTGWSNFVGQKSILEAVAKLIADSADPPIATPARALPFSKAICFDKVSFKYGPSGRDVLREVDLIIGKGQRVGLVGNTGSGKSTSVDLLMGLLSPTTGQITVDGVPLIGQAQREWQRHIGHVSQSIYLADCSLAENIAFGQSAADIDYQRVRTAARQAKIADYIEALPAQYETRVGERGVRLSGGQRQRIGIARAFVQECRRASF